MNFFVKQIFLSVLIGTLSLFAGDDEDRLNEKEPSRLPEKADRFAAPEIMIADFQAIFNDLLNDYEVYRKNNKMADATRVLQSAVMTRIELYRLLIQQTSSPRVRALQLIALLIDLHEIIERWQVLQNQIGKKFLKKISKKITSLRGKSQDKDSNATYAILFQDYEIYLPDPTHYANEYAFLIDLLLQLNVITNNDLMWLRRGQLTEFSEPILQSSAESYEYTHDFLCQLPDPNGLLIECLRAAQGLRLNLRNEPIEHTVSTLCRNGNIVGIFFLTQDYPNDLCDSLFMHLVAFYNCIEIFQIITELLPSEHFMQVLQARDVNHATFLHRAAYFGRTEVFLILSDLYKKAPFMFKFLKSLIRLPNKLKKTPWDLATAPETIHAIAELLRLLDESNDEEACNIQEYPFSDDDDEHDTPEGSSTKSNSNEAQRPVIHLDCTHLIENAQGGNQKNGKANRSSKKSKNQETFSLEDLTALKPQEDRNWYRSLVDIVSGF